MRMDHKLGFHGKNHMEMSSLKEVYSGDPQDVSSFCREGQGHLAERSSGWPTQLQFIVLDCSCMHKLLASKSVEANYSHINNVYPITLYAEMGTDSGIRDYRSNQGPV